MPETTQRRRRRHDPHRRERIIDAAVQIVMRNGLDALTHRAVADEAEVQVGSTTYYFPSKDELVFAVIENTVQKGIATFADRLAEQLTRADLASALTFLMEESVTTQFDQMLVDYEVFAAARRRPSLSEFAGRWSTIEYDAMLKFTDSGTARMLTDLFEGMLVQFILYGRTFRADEVRESFERAIRSAAAE